jgi:N-acetylglucosamine kinase-like BadF-type ATPase
MNQVTAEAVILAVDGGGLNTKTLCADLNGNILGEGLSGPTSLSTTSIGAASFNLRESVRQALEKFSNPPQIKAMVMGLAGMDSPTEHERSSKIFGDILKQFGVVEMVLVNEAVITLESGTNKSNALVLIAGTGSNCYGRNEDGLEAKTGGMDYLLSDQGSGYIIGRQVLRDAVKSYDGRKDKSILEDLVCKHYKIDSISELQDQVYNPDLSKYEVAKLTSVALAALEQNDKLAKSIFDHVNESLVTMAETVITRLKIQDKQVDCVLTGHVLDIPYVHNHFVENMKFVCKQISFIRPEKEPVYGALELALRSLQSAS